MSRMGTWAVLVATICLLGGASSASSASDGWSEGSPSLKSMSTLAFGPDGVLFVGDSKVGQVVAIKTGDTTVPAEPAKPSVKGIEGEIAARLGTDASEILIHDLAANPISQNVYLAVSRGRTGWSSAWQLPNHVSDASILIRVLPDGSLEEVSLEKVTWASVTLSNPISPEKMHPWMKEQSLRSDAITDLAYRDGTLFVAGLSNEEFSSTMWRIPYPFGGEAEATTLEIYHGAHGEWETHAPIRAFVPYDLEGKEHLLAAYLCTPLVTFETTSLEDGEHVKGRTVAEFGSGNYPLDMVVYEKNGKEKLLIANSNLPIMIVDPADVAAFDGELDTRVEGYTAGVPYEIRSGAGIQQLDRLSAGFLVALQRQPNGSMDLGTLDVRRY